MLSASRGINLLLSLNTFIVYFTRYLWCIPCIRQGVCTKGTTSPVALGHEQWALQPEGGLLYGQQLLLCNVRLVSDTYWHRHRQTHNTCTHCALLEISQIFLSRQFWYDIKSKPTRRWAGRCNAVHLRPWLCEVAHSRSTSTSVFVWSSCRSGLHTLWWSGPVQAHHQLADWTLRSQLCLQLQI